MTSHPSVNFFNQYEGVVLLALPALALLVVVLLVVGLVELLAYLLRRR